MVLGGVRLRVGVGLWSRDLMVLCLDGVGDTRLDGVGVSFGVFRLDDVRVCFAGVGVCCGTCVSGLNGVSFGGGVGVCCGGVGVRLGGGGSVGVGPTP